MPIKKIMFPIIKEIINGLNISFNCLSNDNPINRFV